MLTLHRCVQGFRLSCSLNWLERCATRFTTSSEVLSSHLQQSRVSSDLSLHASERFACLLFEYLLWESTILCSVMQHSWYCLILQTFVRLKCSMPFALLYRQQLLEQPPRRPWTSKRELAKNDWKLLLAQILETGMDASRISKLTTHLHIAWLIPIWYQFT